MEEVGHVLGLDEDDLYGGAMTVRGHIV